MLVVAHNAINQGLLNTALGLPPSFFRCFLQSNAAVTVLDFAPPGEGAGPGPRVTVERMNYSPDSPLQGGGGGREAGETPPTTAPRTTRPLISPRYSPDSPLPGGGGGA